MRCLGRGLTNECYGSTPGDGRKKISEHHWTADEFYQAAEAGQFVDPDRLELVQGRLQRLMQGQQHSNLRVRVSRQLRKSLDPPLFVRDENPLHIAFDGEPIPDLMLTYEEEYEGRHPEPQDIALFVEVADTSIGTDLGEKALLYTQASIADYWVVLAESLVIVIHRQPSLNGYEEVTRLTGTDALSPLARPEISWTINELLGRKEDAQGEN
ncbi:MAG: Uma2 family endonuclease [Janthinobacterium lividum]